MSENLGGSQKPRTPAEHAADAAIDLFDERIRAAGGEVKRAVIFAWVEPMRPNGVSAGAGFDDPVELFSFLLTQAEGVGKALGMRLDVIPYDQPKGQG